jgi:GMP synthase (glutamine-hydrolysing)
VSARIKGVIIACARTDLAMKPFLILETGQPLAALQRMGRFDRWIRVAAGLSQQITRTCRVQVGDALPSKAREYSGVLITGSGAMVTDKADWSERSADWLREAIVQGMPIFGICYGHQLIAHALGGEVAYNPRGREMGTLPIRLTDHAQSDALFSGLPPQFLAHTTHMQTVLRAPKDAVVLAKSDQDDCQAFRYGSNVWGVQFHPEFSAEHMRGYIHHRREALHKENKHAKQMHRAVNPAPHARKVLQQFVRHAQRHH